MKNTNESKTLIDEYCIMSTYQHFNLDILSPILDGMNGSELDTIFSKFDEDMQRYSTIAQEAVDRNDITALENASHGLKGVSGMFGALGLSEKAGEIHDQCQTVRQQNDDHQMLWEASVDMINLTKEVMKEADHLKTHYLEQLGKGE